METSINIRPEDHLGNEALCHPMWEKGRTLKLVALEPEHRGACYYPFIDVMLPYIGKKLKFKATRLPNGDNDWWVNIGKYKFLWHTSWLREP